ncbi:MAG: cupredoxin domain-containing protein [Actinomycetota bacterium]|nr:cupredoxin domain-containing protein [Actinomycetota bacterium]
MSKLGALGGVSALVLGLAACGGGSGTTSADAPAGGPSPMSTSASPTPTSASPTPTSASPSPEASTSTGAGTEAAVAIRDFSYDVPQSVPAGATLRVTNHDSAPHTFTVKGGGGGVPAGKTVTLKAPTKPGTYDVVCYFHGDMKGKITVS